MTFRPFRSIALLTALAVVSACSDVTAPDAQNSGNPLTGLEIKTVKAEAVSSIPIGSVPGTVTLPPEARVAVTAPFAGAAVRVFVIEGQAVQRGAPLALESIGRRGHHFPGPR